MDEQKVKRTMKKRGARLVAGKGGEVVGLFGRSRNIKKAIQALEGRFPGVEGTATGLRLVVRST